MKRPRVLVLAEACNPQMVSVPLVGWFHYESLNQVADVHLVTQIRNRQAILEAGKIEGKDFTAIDTEYIAKRVYKFANFIRGGEGRGWTTLQALSWIYDRAFEKLTWQHFESRIKAGEFDLIHRITPVSPTVPFSIIKKCRKVGIPVVLGPQNGGVPWPKGFGKALVAEREWLSKVRSAYKLLPGFRATRKLANAIIVASGDTFQQVNPKLRDKCVYIAENAIDLKRFNVRRTRKFDGPVRAIFVGRLVPYKGADMLIEAAQPLLSAGKMHLRIIGDGPQKPDLQALIDKFQLQSSVTLAGWVKHTAIAQEYADSDVAVFPSIREFGGAVAMEAMAVGLPPIVCDYGGLGEIVTDRTGFKLKMGTREQIVSQLRETLTRIVADPSLIESRVPACLRRAHEQFTWSAKAQQVLQVYNWVLGRAPKPDFPLPTPDLPDNV